MPCRALTVVLVIAAASIQLTAAGQDYQGPVGSWGDPARIQIEGARQLDADLVKKGLAGSFRHFMASHPSAPLAGFTKSVQQHLLLGYQRAGFGEVKVAVRLDYDARQVVVQIDEGPRRRAGAIRVEGPAKIRELLTDSLVARRPPDGATPAELSDYGGVIAWADANGKEVDEEKPLWVPGQPAQLDAPAAENRRKRVGQTLADLGFDQAEFESTVIADGLLAEWHIRINDLGPPAVLRDIETTGNQKHTREEIVSYLNLRPGTVVTREFRQRIERSLWNSARFTASKVDVEQIPGQSGVLLKIDVQEYAPAPRLSEPLSREERALMKYRHWMIHGAGSQLDMVVTATRPTGRLEVILSPVEGISSCLWKTPDADGPPAFAVLATDQNLAAYALASGRVLSAPVSGVQLNATLALEMNAENPAHPRRIKFGFGFKSLEDGETRSPLTLTTSMPPVYFLAHAHEKAECSWEGQMLTIRSKQGTMRIDERTGELIDYAAQPSEVDGTAFGYAFERGAFTRRRQLLLDASAGKANDFDGARPISSVSAFLLNTEMLSAMGGFVFGEKFSERAPQASLAALGKLIDHGLLAGADTMVIAMTKKDGETFKIPAQPDPAQPFQLKHFYGFLVAQAADHVFPRDSWAWTMWRESSLVVAGLSQHTGTELNKIMSDARCGPSSYWLLAELLNSIQQPVGPIAQQGLRRFNREAFIREWETALGSELHPSVAATLEALRSLSDDDVAALTALADGPKREWIRIAGQMRTATEPRPDHTTADLLEGIWSTELRDRLEQRLRQLAAPPRVSERLPNAKR